MGAMALRGFMTKHHPPVPESCGKGLFQTGPNRLRECLVHGNSALFHEACMLSSRRLSVPSCLFMAGKTQRMNFAACA